MPGRRSKNRSSTISGVSASNSNRSAADCNISSASSASENENTNAKALPEWFQKCKSYKILEYDTTRFPFRELVADWLEVSTRTRSDKHNNDCDKGGGGDDDGDGVGNRSDDNINMNGSSNSNSNGNGDGDGDGDELSVLDDLHTLLPTAVEKSSSAEPLVLHPLVRQAYISAKIQPALSSTMRRAKKKGLFASPQYHRFVNAYRLFIREVINPLCHDHNYDCEDDND
eukprot:949886_1